MTQFIPNSVYLLTLAVRRGDTFPCQDYPCNLGRTAASSALLVRGIPVIMLMQEALYVPDHRFGNSIAGNRQIIGIDAQSASIATDSRSYFFPHVYIGEVRKDWAAGAALRKEAVFRRDSC